MKKNTKKNEVNYIQVEKTRYRLNFKWILTIFFIILIMSIFYAGYVKSLTYKNIYNNISELSEQTAAQLNLVISDHKKFVEIMVDSINNGFFKTTDEIFNRFEGDLEDYNFTRLVVLDENGNGVTSDGFTVNNYQNIEEFFNQDNVYLSENRPSTVSNKQVNIYSKVFNFNGEKRVLFATINTENYKDILLRRLFNGKGGTYLINNNGSVLIDSFDIIKDNNVNLYDFINTNFNLTGQKDINKISTMKNDIKNLKVGTFDIDFHNDTYFMHYEKLEINDWYIVTIAPASAIGKELSLFLTLSLSLCLLINLVIICICIYIDISNQKKNKKLYNLAYIDSVTGIGNEAYFKENGNIFLQDETKSKYIISLDINKFKALNNLYGHKFCDKILSNLAQKLTKVLPLDSITSRMSSDIFAMIFSYEKNINTLLNKIFTTASTIKIDNKKINLNLSIGVYKINLNDSNINQVLDKAYMAREKIKGQYNQNYYIFDSILENQLVEEQQIESYMDTALKNHEFKIMYQPKVSSITEKVVGAEALVRWEKNGIIIPPDKFIPLFEKNKFIIKLDLYIFEQVCKDISIWKEKFKFIPTISINVSKEHFSNENFINDYVKISDTYNIEKSEIDLEITESSTIDDSIDVLKVLNNIKEQGFIISIDDFGTGYSSLSMLLNMPIDIIKIDKVFIDKANLNNNQNIINYIKNIADFLNVKTIVEGVETKEQAEFIKKLKCDIIQGYYYSRPLSLNEFENYFNRNS